MVNSTLILLIENKRIENSDFAKREVQHSVRMDHKFFGVLQKGHNFSCKKPWLMWKHVLSVVLKIDELDCRRTYLSTGSNHQLRRHAGIECGWIGLQRMKTQPLSPGFPGCKQDQRTPFMRAEQAFQTPLGCVQCLKLSHGARLSWHTLLVALSKAAGCHQHTATSTPGVKGVFKY